MKRQLAVVIMAAGKGKRMNNPDMAKVMYTINEKPLIEHVVDLAHTLDAARVVAVVGWQKDSVISHLKQTGKPVVCVEQSPLNGTGHAVMQTSSELKDFTGDVLILSGDVPMLSPATVRTLIAYHHEQDASATVLTAILDDATGYGRIIRSEKGDVVGIIEHKDATAEQLAVKEINSGIYVFDAGPLFAALKDITPDNAQNEYYLTDVFGIFWKKRLKVAAVSSNNPAETRGINTMAQLEEARVTMVNR